MVKVAPDYTAFNDALDSMLTAAGPMALSTTYFPDTLAPELKRNRNFNWITDTILRADNEAFLLTIKNNFRPHAGCNVIVDPYTVSAFGGDGGYLLFPQDEPFLDSNVYTNYPDEFHRLLVMFKFWNIINYFNPYNYVLDKPTDTILMNNVVNIDSASNIYSFYNWIIKMAASLDDAHVQQLTYSEDVTWPNEYLPYLMLDYIQGKYVVVKSAVAGISVGDAIVSVDGRTTGQWEDSLSNYISAGNVSVLRRFISQYLLLWGDTGTTSNVVYADTSGTTYSTTITRPITLGNPWFPVVYYPADSLSGITWTTMECGTGYINNVSQTTTEANHAYTALRDAPAIIIDLRESTSNDDGAVTLLFDMASETPKFSDIFMLPDVTYPGTFYWEYDTLVSTKKTPYNGTVILLVNEQTQSHTEYYSMLFKTFPKIVIVGSQTAGTDGNVTYFRLAQDLHSGFTSLGVFYPNGDSTQRIGIVPDSVVTPTIAGIMQGRDEVLEKALQIACSIPLSSPRIASDTTIVMVYPNPANNAVTIEAKNLSAQNMTISISDITGWILLQKNIENTTGNISAVMDINALSPGMYFVNLNTGPLQYVTKIIKE